MVAAATILSVVPVALAATGISNQVTLDGVGGVVPGMSAKKVAALWGIDPPSRRRACAVVKVRGAAGNLNGYALFLHGRFGAVFFTSGATTAGGVRLGSRLATLTATYGRKLQSAPGSNTYFLTRKQSPHYEIRFDVEKGRVTLIGFGDEAVHFVGGCGYTR